MADKNEQIEANKATFERILDKAEELGIYGFTTEEMANALGQRKDIVVNLMYKLRIRGEIRPIHSKVRVNALKRPLQVFKFHKRLSFQMPSNRVIGICSYRNVFQFIAERGHDEDFEPRPAIVATSALPGSLDKVETIRARLERGESLWHPQDTVGGFIRCGVMEVRA
jgi:hypothetical protein